MIYLDNNATTRLHQQVYHKQCEILNKYYGNPSSIYPEGVIIKEFINHSRRIIANFINADIEKGDQIIFTSGATESNNSVFNSSINRLLKNNHVIISAVEHPSVYNTAKYYESLGCEVTIIGVNKDGVINEEQLISSLKEETRLVSIMLVNSETGIINDIANLSSQIRKKNPKIIIHTDAVQAAGKIPIDVQKLNVDFLTLSGHKFGAPKGIGVLYINANTIFNPYLIGGHQEFGIRAGTENTASIVAMGEAALVSMKNFELGVPKSIEKLRMYMEENMISMFPNSIIIGRNSPRVCNTTNIGFKNVDGDKLVLQLAQLGICVSSGTACNSTNSEPSRVLKSMNVSEEYIRSIRISLGVDTKFEDITQFLNAIKQVIK